MKVLKRFLTSAAAAMVLLSAGVAVANASVYDTPGGQIQNGRLWSTDCEMYSSNVVRCQTDIWATQVVYRNGAYTRVTGWTFNNLTYLPSPRASWAGNNLGHNVASWNSGGRTWRTECDTPATGRGACRSYIWTQKATATWVGGRWVYTAAPGWVFNNLVLFSGSGIAPVTSIPDHILDQSYLDFTGYGPIGLHAKATDLEKLGYLDWITSDVCDYWAMSDELDDRSVYVNMTNFSGTDVDLVHEVILTRAGPETVDGAQVTMTVGEIRAIYGADLQLQTKDGYQDVYVAVVREGRYELVFVSDFELERPLVDSDVISLIIAREADEWLGWDGC